MKFPFDFSVKLVFRLVLPGIILAAAMVPAVHATLRGLGFPDKFAYAYPLEVIAWGWLLIISDMPIYMLYEGRRYWPPGIRRLFIWLQEKRLKKLTFAVFNEPPESRAQLEASVEFCNYPIEDSGKSYVQYPTRLGNIIAAYENYPQVNYGLDSVFYWYRLWVVLDKDIREEIDNSQSVVDSTVYASFAFYLSGLVLFGYAGIGALQQTSWQAARYVSSIHLPYVPSDGILCLMGFTCIVLAFAIYRLSLPAHAQFGELFKSIFDMHQSKLTFDDVIKIVSDFTENPLLLCKSRYKKNEIALMYLKWHRIQNDKTDEYQAIGEWQSPTVQDGDHPVPDSSAASPA